MSPIRPPEAAQLHRMIHLLRLAGDWERAAGMLSRAEYEALLNGLQALAEAISHLSPVVHLPITDYLAYLQDPLVE